MDADLRYALELADAADALTLARFRAVDLHVETKPDLTPVTDADRATERMLRERIAAERPDESVLGEEEGDDGAARRWIVIRSTDEELLPRIPVWATLIALERDGAIVCGVASAPALAAAGGQHAARRYRNGERLAVSRIASLDDASVSFSRSSLLGATERTLAVAEQAWHMQPFSDFWAHLLVAEGGLEVAFEHEMSPWDNAALQVIVEEAGGRFSDLSGAPRYDGGSAVSTNGLLHDEVLALLNA